MMQITLVSRLKSSSNNRGQGMIEYVLILGLIALAMVVSWPPLAEGLTDKLTEFAAKVRGS